MDLKDSCPAVSQIWSLICLSLMLTMRLPNSTPMVRSWTCWNLLSVNCRSRHDLPTPVFRKTWEGTGRTEVSTQFGQHGGHFSEGTRTLLTRRKPLGRRVRVEGRVRTRTCVADDDVLEQIPAKGTGGGWVGIQRPGRVGATRLRVARVLFPRRGWARPGGPSRGAPSRRSSRGLNEWISVGDSRVAHGCLVPSLESG